MAPDVQNDSSHVSQVPAKQSRWSPEEDAKIIKLRGRGVKWEDISKELPGRSATSCRLRYQNYLERRSEWDEDRKNKLARLYERWEWYGTRWQPAKLLTKQADSRQKCGQKLQRRWVSPGGPQKLCTGS
ncbi:predicted protein [Histoplasma mississippiense (nom. inval.)]|uniref:predicted protein n=1 Tax=Ajellomyces capsulatus (strain NAm1 / WU24) TaxID=2059318 RepID=UPI000157C707|nr:predicted protein [Histoplasma mississippiense (nom. inval.)]EDN08856.1 predicted protein [Histoplasma mississippiense (nom. inval.)]